MMFREFEIHRKTPRIFLRSSKPKGMPKKKCNKILSRLCVEDFALKLLPTRHNTVDRLRNIILLTDFHLSQSNYLLLIHEMAAL